MDKLMNVAISGKMASGKTEIANHLCDKYGYTRYYFAKPMKELEAIHQTYKQDNQKEKWLIQMLEPYVYRLCVPYQEAIDQLLKLYNETPLVLPKNREFLQKIGTDIIRKLNPNAWVDYAFNYIKDIEGPVVIDDVRFLNEADTSKKNGFFLLRLEAYDEQRFEKIKELYGEEALHPSRINHASELELDGYKNFDLIMHNNYDDRLKSYAEALHIVLSKGR